MAGVAKGLRQWVVVPSFAGSIPVIRPFKRQLNYLKYNLLIQYGF